MMVNSLGSNKMKVSYIQVLHLEELVIPMVEKSPTKHSWVFELQHTQDKSATMTRQGDMGHL
jgi:hypothetical protein